MHWKVTTLITIVSTTFYFSTICECATLPNLNLKRSRHSKGKHPTASFPLSKVNFYCKLDSHSNVKCSDVEGKEYPLNLTDDGYLRVGLNGSHFPPGTSSEVYHPPSEFCVLRDRRHAKLCPSQIPPNPSWRKCCPQSHLLNPKRRKSCIESPTSSLPKFRPRINGSSHSFFVTNAELSKFTCPKGYHLRKFSRNMCAERSMTSFVKATLSHFGGTLDDPSSASHDHAHAGGDDDTDADADADTATDRFQLSQNGTISIEVATGVFLRKSEWKVVEASPNFYCVDGVIHPPSTSHCGNDNDINSLQQSDLNGINKSGRDTNNDDSDIMAPFVLDSACNGKGGRITPVLFICVENIQTVEAQEDVRSKTLFLSVIWLMTCPLLLLSALGNLFLIQKNVHGWILTAYLMSMCILNVLSVIVILDVGGTKSDGEHEYDRDDGDEEIREDNACTPLDFFIKFMYMSTLCWMTSINFGLWKTFSYTIPQSAGVRRFLASVIFSLGFPALSITICYYVAYSNTHPQCKQEYCLLFSHDTIPFYSGPICVLVLGNFAIFLKTSYTIARLRREAEDVLRRQAQDHLESFTLFAKLFLLTGSIWLLRLVLLVLQVNGSYLTWVGVIIETVFSIPEVVFPIMLFHHPEFIKWSWRTSSTISSFIFKFDPLFNLPPANKTGSNSKDIGMG